MLSFSHIRAVFAKELADALRDRRALLTVALVSVAAGPLLLLMLANMLAGFEARAERRIALVEGLEYAPTLGNYLERETVTLLPAPPGYREALTLGRLPDPVLQVPPDFEVALKAGRAPRLVIHTDSSNGRADAGVARLQRWLSGFAAQRGTLELALRGIAPDGRELRVEEYDLANPLAQTTRVFGMLPFFFVLAALYGAWGAALDTTVGERERGTLEPLRLTRAGTGALLGGKWLAVSVLGGAIAALAVLSFLPAQALMRGETLRAMFAFGWAEAAWCIALLLPLAALFAALLMAAGARARTMREAQAGATALMLFSTLPPLLVQTGEGGHAGWHGWAPVVAQHTHILALLRGDALPASALAVSALACLALAAVALYLAGRGLRRCR